MAIDNNTHNATILLAARQSRGLNRAGMSGSRAAGNSLRYPPVTDRVVASDLYLTSIGRLSYQPGSDYPRGGHPADYAFSWRQGRRLNDFALVWIESGSGEKELAGGRSEPFLEHEAILLTPGSWHRYRPNPSSGWRERWVSLNGEHLLRLRRRGLIPGANCSLGLQDEPDWRASFERLLDEVCAGDGDNHLHWGAVALRILLQACGGWPARQRLERADGLIGRALELIRQNSHRSLSVRWLAAALETTPRTLERHFAERHGRSPRAEIIHARIERATRLLASPEIPVKEIAYTCGFGSPKLMNHNFRRCRGMTPTELRRRLLAGGASPG